MLSRKNVIWRPDFFALSFRSFLGPRYDNFGSHTCKKCQKLWSSQCSRGKTCFGIQIFSHCPFAHSWVQDMITSDHGHARNAKNRGFHNGVLEKRVLASRIFRIVLSLIPGGQDKISYFPGMNFSLKGLHSFLGWNHSTTTISGSLWCSPGIQRQP